MEKPTSFPRTELQRLQLEHVDTAAVQDIEFSNSLATDQKALAAMGYFHGRPLIGSIAGMAIVLAASYWSFGPAAAILIVINADIGPSDNASLFSIVWSMCAAIGMISFGRLSDKFGRRWFLVGASSLAVVGGIIAGTAQSMNVLIGANVLLGLAAGVHSCYVLIVGEICPNKYKYLGVVFCLIPNIIPTGFGAYLSTMLTHTASWRWVYYIQIMIMVPGTILQFVYYRPPSFNQLHGGTRTISQEVKRIDIVGMFLLISGICLFVLGVSWGGQPALWTSSKILGLVITGGCLGIIFVFWEIFSNVPNPLVPMYFFRDFRGYVCIMTIEVVSGVVYIALSIIWPSQVSRIYGGDGSDWKTNAWLSTTVAFGFFAGAVSCGTVFHLIKRVRYQLIVYVVVCVTFIGALSATSTDHKGRAAAFSFIAAFPAGIMEVVPGVLVQLDCDDAQLGTAFAIIALIRTVFGSVMTAVFLAILQSKVPVELARYVPTAALNAGLPKSSLADLSMALGSTSADALAKVPGMTEAIQAAVAQAVAQSYASAYAYVYYAAVAVGGMGLVAVICLKDYDALLTGHVSRQIYERGAQKQIVAADEHEMKTAANRTEEVENVNEV